MGLGALLCVVTEWMRSNVVVVFLPLRHGQPGWLSARAAWREAHCPLNSKSRIDSSEGNQARLSVYSRNPLFHVSGGD